MPEQERDGDVLIWRVPVPSGVLGWIRARRALFRQVSKWAGNGEIDLVETPDYQGLAAYWPALNVPVVARLHGSSTYFGSEMRQPVNRITYRLERASLRRADFLCSVSRYTAERTESLFDLRTGSSEVIYNTVALPDSPGDTERDRFRVVYSGTIVAKKGIVSLMKAWPEVVKAIPAARLHVYGKDTRTESGGSQWERLAAALDSISRHTVHFHGHVDVRTVRKALREAGMAIFPSYSEAFALAPMEAMAEGCPTIFTTRSSGPELIEHERTGLLIDPERPEDIVRSLIRLLENPREARELGRAGRESIQRRFAPEEIIRQNVQFFQNCLQAFRGAAKLANAGSSSIKGNAAVSQN